MIVFALLIICAAIGLVILVRYLEATGVFFPNKEINITPAQMRLPYEDLYVTTSDGIKINAWLLKNPGAKFTLIYAHGNAGNMGDRLLKVKFFRDLGLNVLIFDYRGYGNSHGHPSEPGVYLDAQAVYDYLKTRTDIDAHRVIAYGTSLGGVVAVDLAAHRPLAGLIIDSSITSAREAARHFYPYLPSFILHLRFDSLSKVRDLTIPKLIIHSPEDQTIPYVMGQRLFEAAAEPKEFLTSSGGHNEIQILNDPKTAAGVKQFLVAHHLL